MITHVVFDFDGTIAASAQVALQLYNELARKNGYGLLTADNLDAVRKMSVRERCSHLGVPPYRLPWLVVQLTRSYRQAIHQIEFNAGIPELLRELRARGLQLVILSSNSEENIRAFLKRHSAEGWVDDIYCSSSLFGKDRLLRALMRRARLQPGQLVYVGDEQRDVEACKKAGVRMIAVQWGVDAESLLRQAGPDHLVERPADIIECLSRWSTQPPMRGLPP